VTPPVALTIAGSDSGGGAGIQADLATFAALGVHGTSVVTAITAQSTVAVHAVEVTSVGMVEAQLDAVLDDLPVAAVKAGMLATEAIVAAVAARAARGQLPHLVVDPVMVASSGARLLEPGAEAAYRDHLLPHATVAAPNAAEAGVLLGAPLADLAAVRRAAPALAALGARWLVVTGVPDGDRAVDVVVGPDGVDELPGAWVATANDHGTGCTFASAVAAQLAHGRSVPDALALAKAFVAVRLARSAGWRLGAGHGPVDHTCG
jgi:hydroxymethylpyrimidine/phosphomethylpyrimidine kinase